MRKSLILPLAVFLASCGGGQNVTEGTFPVASATKGACGLPYYSELIGTYSGTLTRDTGAFDTDFEVSGTSKDGMCDLNFNLSTLSALDDVGVHGIIRTDVDIPGNEAFWNNPQYPVDAGTEFRAATEAGDTVFGKYSVVTFVATFDGNGNVTINETEGTLVKSE